MIRKRSPSIFFALACVLAAASASADDAVPEIQRPDATPQAVGALHTLRTIPEACVRLEGEFTGDRASPYRLAAVPTQRCAQRAIYVPDDSLQAPPGIASGWILNDRIRVPRADAPACVATIEVWRKPGDAAPPALDAQGRSRIYLDHPVQSTPVRFTAVLMTAAVCR